MLPKGSLFPLFSLSLSLPNTPWCWEIWFLQTNYVKLICHCRAGRVPWGFMRVLKRRKSNFSRNCNNSFYKHKEILLTTNICTVRNATCTKSLLSSLVTMHDLAISLLIGELGVFCCFASSVLMGHMCFTLSHTMITY